MCGNLYHQNETVKLKKKRSGEEGGNGVVMNVVTTAAIIYSLYLSLLLEVEKSKGKEERRKGAGSDNFLTCFIFHLFFISKQLFGTDTKSEKVQLLLSTAITLKFERRWRRKKNKVSNKNNKLY